MCIFLKPVVVLTCVFALLSSGSAQQAAVSESTPSVMGLRVSFVTTHVDGKLGATEVIAYEFLSVGSNSTATVFLPQDAEYLYRVSMFDASGIPVLKTKLGDKTGSRFEGLDRTARFSRNASPFTIFQTSTNEVKTRRIRVEKSASAPILPSPSELFDIPQSGVYKLQFQLQCYKIGTNNLAQLLIFPPIEVPVIKR
jgi:hypothetical protein